MSISDDMAPPSRWRRTVEFAGVVPRLANSIGHLGPRGPVGGPPALVVPGFLATDRTTLALRRALADAGFRVHPWGMGPNMGARADTIDRLVARLAAFEAPVLLVGWSLGGLYARELARAAPGKVRAVVTLGSPFSGDPRANNVWRLYEWIAGHSVDSPPIARDSAKPPVPTLALWSRRDGIVAPAAARGLPRESDRAVELACGHMAFGVSRRAGRAVVREIDSFLKMVEG
ncbi:alpha/beta hydrolase [Sphingomonas sp. ASV193]|uniref:alpha/beta hydrolase n=1 Tax=Sphingomonas sp. ASV193 TaxID=3144405 RepID=UPI0032E922B9